MLNLAAGGIPIDSVSANVQPTLGNTGKKEFYICRLVVSYIFFPSFIAWTLFTAATLDDPDAFQSLIGPIWNDISTNKSDTIFPTVYSLTSKAAVNNVAR